MAIKSAGQPLVSIPSLFIHFGGDDNPLNNHHDIIFANPQQVFFHGCGAWIDSTSLVARPLPSLAARSAQASKPPKVKKRLNKIGGQQ